MEENTRNEIIKLLSALKALRTSSTRATHMGTYDAGTAQMMVKTYTALHARIKELLPDDYYVTDALQIEITPETSDKAKVVQVQLAADQLFNYLKDQVKGDWGEWHEFGKAFGVKKEEMQELADLGKELQSQILERTRSALRRALSGLEVEIDKEIGKEEGKRKTRVEIHMNKDSDEDDDKDEATDKDDDFVFRSNRDETRKPDGDNDPRVV